MTLRLPDPPDELQGPARAFYGELREMLDVLRPGGIDPARCSTDFERDSVEVRLAHVSDEDWSIWAIVSERDGIAGIDAAHEHFFAPEEEAAEERPWTTEIVDFVAEILRGEVEVETTYRGDTPIATSHYNLDEHGRRRELSRTVFLPPARLALWRPKRVETRRQSFL